MSNLGLKGDKDYDEKIEIKRAIADEHNIPLIELESSDLPSLDSKLNNLKREYGGQKLPIVEGTVSIKGSQRKIFGIDSRSMELLNIPSIGKTIIKRLNDKNIYSLEDIQNCGFETLFTIEGLGDTLIRDLLTRAGREEECYLLDLKKAPGVWNETIIQLSNTGINSIDRLAQYTIEDLCQIEGIGSSTAKKLFEYVNSLDLERF